MGPEKKFFYLCSDAQYSLKFPARIVPTPLFLPIYVIMTSFPRKLTKFFSFVDFYFIHSHFSCGRTWISKLGSLNEWHMGDLQTHLWRHTIMTSHCRNKTVIKIVKNYHFEWLLTSITFVTFNIEPWYYHWTKCMHIKGSCINSVYFDQHFYTINYTENMTPFRNTYRISAFCLSFNTEFILITIFASIIHFYFSNRENFRSIIRVKNSWRHMLVNNHKNGPKFVLVL